MIIFLGLSFFMISPISEPNFAHAETAVKHNIVKPRAEKIRLNQEWGIGSKKVVYTVRPRMITLGFTTCSTKPRTKPKGLLSPSVKEYPLMKVWYVR